MTREEILAMKPGRELDELIAELVMGWKRSGACFTTFNDRTEIRTIEPTSYGGFQPSTDIAAAWEVWEKTCDPNRSSIIPIGNGSTGLEYAIAYDNEPYVWAKTAPHAICVAALLAVEVEHE